MTDEKEAIISKDNVTVKDTGPCRKQVSVEVPEEAVKDAIDKRYNELRREAVVPGFRKGRAPRKLLEKRFGKEALEAVKLALVAEASQAAVKDCELDVLREPDIDIDKLKLPEEGCFAFEFDVEVRPEVSLPQLEGIEVERVAHEVTDEQIDAEILRMRKWSGSWRPHEGKAEPEDQVVADVAVTVGDSQPEKLDNTDVYLRPNGFVGEVPVEDLDKQLAGAKPGETRHIEVDVPKTYFRERYRGEKVGLDLRIKELKSLEPAPLDQAFMERVGADNEQELKENVRDRLQYQLEQQNREAVSEQIYRYLLDKTELELPLDLVAEQATMLLRRQYASLLIRGLSREQVEERMDQLRAGSEEQAREQLKIYFIMDKVASALGVEASEEEINGRIAQLAVQRAARPERLKEQLDKEGALEQLRGQVRDEKCIARLLESAKVKQVSAEKAAKKSLPGKKRTRNTGKASVDDDPDKKKA